MKRGFALIYTLLITSVLLVMITALMTGVHGESFFTRNHSNNVAALYVAEAGVHYALDQLEANNAWSDDVVDMPMAGGRGTFSIYFSTGESVNNLEGTDSVDGPRGVDTVPRGTADITVIAKVGVATQRLEVILAGSGPAAGLAEGGMVSTGNVRLFGDVMIDGLEALGSETPVAGDLHTNNGAGTITWTPIGLSDRADVTGQAGTANSDTSAIDFGVDTSRYSLGSTDFGNTKPLQHHNIVNEVSAKSGANPLVYDQFATNSLAPGDYYLDGTMTINGDLILDDANVYVTGDIDINGTIKGNGSVYVVGESKLRGDATIVADEDQRVALFSHGSVELTGFDGTKYIDDFVNNSGDSNIQRWWDDSKTSLQAIQNVFDSNDAASSLTGSNKSTIDQHRAALSWKSPGGSLPSGRSEDQLLKNLHDAMNSMPDTDSKAFVQKKLNTLHEVFYPIQWDSTPVNDAQALAAVQSGQIGYGAFDAIVDNGAANPGTYGTEMPKIMNYVNQVDYDRIGTSYFQGLVYTNGFVYAANEITVLGALIADDDGSQSPKTIDGETYNPGDVALLHNSRLTYVESFFEDDGAASGFGTGDLGVLRWLGR